MFDFYFERLLNDAANFSPREGNKVVEIVDNHGTVDCEERHINDADIARWVSEKSMSSKDRPSLQLLIGAPEEHDSDAEILPLPISRSTFEVIRKSWRLPTEFLRMMMSTLPLTIAFDTRDADGRLVKGLMLRGGRSRDWNFCLALIYNPVTRSTQAILNGMQHAEIKSLVTCLRKSREHVRDPMMLPLFLLEWKVHFFAILLERRCLGIEGIEHSTGMRHGFSKDPKKLALIDQERKIRAKALDFDPITQKLTGVTGTLSFCDMTFSSSKEALQVVTKLRTDIESERCEQTTDDRDRQTKWATGMRIDYLEALIAGAQAHCAVLSARTKAQVQTVYSMIGQRDNRLNIETAATSRDIAEDSRRVAILTRKDSLDMRIIAGVTLVFLPGTFMATMFGSGFFNFLPENSTKVVSEWIWLYFALTIAVTTTVLLFWWYFSNRHSRRFLDIERQQVGSSITECRSRETVTSNNDSISMTIVCSSHEQKGLT